MNQKPVLRKFFVRGKCHVLLGVFFFIIVITYKYYTRGENIWKKEV
jgi:hypothetical protein